MAIAIVDDTPLNLTLIQALVRKLTPPGTEIVTFTSPLEGLQWCGSNEPDLLIVDYMMPDINGIEFIDLVCVNLYPFRQTIAKEGVTLAEAIENIDIGGPSMLRSAAKNFRDVTVVCDPADYAAILDEMAEKLDGLPTSMGPMVVERIPPDSSLYRFLV